MPRIRQSEVGASFATGSGFILRSPRILIRENDDNPGSYPTVLRDGDSNRLGNDFINFNDDSTIVFENASPFFPSMLPRNSSFRSQAADILGEESDIQMTVPIRSAQIPVHLRYSSDESLLPFDENKTIPASDFYLSGTDPDILPGFLSPIRSKTSIEIDITPRSDTLVMRNVNRRTVGEGGASIGDKTGFLYYNFERKEWEQIGLKDPATGNNLYYDFAYSSAPSARSGTFPYQFSHTMNASFATTESLETLGYSKIGSPSIALGAPDDTKYHATSSQVIKLSNYISSPFLLEKIRVEFGEINAQRINGGTEPFDHDNQVRSIIFASGSSRDIDNFVFFLYRQGHGGHTVDSVQDVSSSTRFLIASASMAFWNSASLLSQNLLHSPAFEYEYGLPYNNSYAVGKFTGSINLEFHPAVCGPQFLGTSTVQRPSEVINLIANVWPGSTSNRNFNFQGKGILRATSLDDSLSQIIDKYVRFDHRATRKLGGETADPSVFRPDDGDIPVSLNTPQSNISPYLLMPQDELVLGVEAGVAPGYFAGNFSHITGSFLRIKNKRCKITLFGSQISNGEESLFNLNQKITSDSIHEIVGAEKPLDQFQIEPIESYYGTYLDEVVTGSMAVLNENGTFTVRDQDNSRRVISRISVGQAGFTGSFQRFLNVSDFNERLYDSCLPEIVEMLNVNSVPSPYSYLGENVPAFIAPDDAYWMTEESFTDSVITQFPFAGNPVRRISDPIAVLSASQKSSYPGSDIASYPIGITGAELDSLLDIFKVRNTTFSIAPSDELYNISKPPYYLIGSREEINLTNGLVAWYRPEITTNNPIDTLVNGVSSPGANTTLQYVTTGPSKVLGSAVFPPSGIYTGNGFSMGFTAGGTKMLEAVGDADDHKMGDGSADFDFTISTVFKLDSLPGAGESMFILERRASQTGNRRIEYSLLINDSGNIVFRKGRGTLVTQVRRATGSTTLQVGIWYHVIVRFSAPDTDTTASYSIWLNGVSETLTFSSTAGPAAAQVNSSCRLRIGVGLDNSSATETVETSPDTRFKGVIHTIKMWKNLKFNAEQVSQLYQLDMIGSAIGERRHRAGVGSLGIDRAIALRYGVANVKPQFSTSQWRMDRYGQVRDLLEPRKYFASPNAPNPINIRFVSSASMQVDPTSTNSQNISTFATSSLPFFDDGVARNRSNNPDLSFWVVDPATLTIVE